MNIIKPTVGSAIASIIKGIKQLESVIESAVSTVKKENETIAKAMASSEAANAEAERAARIKAKLEELVA